MGHSAYINTRPDVLFECAVLLYAVCTCMQQPKYTDIHLQVPIYKVQVFANYTISIKIPKELLLVQGYSNPSASQSEEFKSWACQCRRRFRKCHRDNARLAKTASRPARNELFVIGSQQISPPKGKEKRKRPPDKRLHNAQGLV